MPQRVITIKDVARKAEVSLATVSRVINNADNVRPAMREKVQAAIGALGYNPNLAARSLVKKSTNSIGIVVNNLHDPFFHDLIKGFEEGAQATDYNSLFCSIRGGDMKSKEKYVKYLSSGVVDGIILYGSYTTDESIVRYLRDETSIDYVMIENDIPDLACNKLLIDNRGGARQAVEYLISQGHRDIAHICGDSNRKVTTDRFSGYIEAMQSGGCTVREKYIQHADSGYEGGYNCMIELLSAPVRPTAVFCSDDAIASYAVRAALEKGLEIPRDLSIMGFDNQTILPNFYRGPGITSVEQPLYQIGMESVQLLANRLESKKESAPVCRIYETKLVDKETVAPPQPR